MKVLDARMRLYEGRWALQNEDGVSGSKMTAREAKKAAGTPRWPSGKKNGHPGS